jgi:hypothetical protein
MLRQNRPALPLTVEPVRPDGYTEPEPAYA